MPYPGGERLGMVDEAISAFSKFTGQNLAEIRAQAQISELGETTIEAEVAIDEINPNPES
ncbi:hypothetical protein ACN4EK_10510 [Pantanalinema rosaneae CENA516]|uniref:hypothetical protein n=1 Tax=Pantanalinema rosaneae TaxID=1620701 RepID=UPI003D6FA2B6